MYSCLWSSLCVCRDNSSCVSGWLVACLSVESTLAAFSPKRRNLDDNEPWGWMNNWIDSKTNVGVREWDLLHFFSKLSKKHFWKKTEFTLTCKIFRENTYSWFHRLFVNFLQFPHSHHSDGKMKNLLSPKIFRQINYLFSNFSAR